MNNDPIELEPEGEKKTITPIGSAADGRLPSYQPPPVMLQAVADVALPLDGHGDKRLDDFYVELLRFEKIDAPLRTYRAEKHHLVFHPAGEQIFRHDAAPVGLVTPFFWELRDGLKLRKMEYRYLQGIVAGDDSLLFQDPCGNWLSVTRWSSVR